jgi:hypothetical protein
MHSIVPVLLFRIHKVFLHYKVAKIYTSRSTSCGIFFMYPLLLYGAQDIRLITKLQVLILSFI